MRTRWYLFCSLPLMITLQYGCGGAPDGNAGLNDGMDGDGGAMNGGMDGNNAGNQDPNAPATFTVDGTTARMFGTIGPTTPAAVQDLINRNPNLTTIVLVNVPGSEDDNSNLQASRLVRQAGLATHVPAGAGVASGGTDFFLSGTTRTMDPGAVIGVHSWEDNANRSGSDLKNANPNWATDPDHTLFTDYYREMGLADPEGFYCFTLQAAPPENIYNMTSAEKNQYGMCSPNPCP